MKKSPPSLAKREAASDLFPFEAYDRRFEDLFRSHFPVTRTPWWTRLDAPAGDVSPTVNIYEEGSDVVVKAEIPVMKKRNIHVDINDRTVTIHSDKRSCGSFASTVDLPAAVQMEKARASFKDGVLEVRVPKTGKVSRRTRKIAGE